MTDRDPPTDPPSTLALLVEDFATHDHDLTTPGFWAVATHRLGTRALDPSRPRAERAVLDLAYRALFTGVDWIGAFTCRARLPSGGGCACGTTAPCC